MNLLDLKIGIAWFIVSFIVLPFAGFVFRTAQLQKKEKRIKELEEEMITNHAEILALQGQLAIPKGNSARAVSIEECRQFSENASKGKLKVSTL